MRALHTSAAVFVVATLMSRTPHDGRSRQRVWQSDVSVHIVELSVAKPAAPITTRIVVAADSDDARAVRLEIMLPVGVGVLETSEVCRSSPSPVMSLSARVSCALGDVRVREPRSVSITTTGRPSGRPPLRFAAFAFSDTPDPRPANNFAERGLP